MVLAENLSPDSIIERWGVIYKLRVCRILFLVQIHVAFYCLDIRSEVRHLDFPAFLLFPPTWLDCWGFICGGDYHHGTTSSASNEIWMISPMLYLFIPMAFSLCYALGFEETNRDAIGTRTTTILSLGSHRPWGRVDVPYFICHRDATTIGCGTHWRRGSCGWEHCSDFHHSHSHRNTTTCEYQRPSSLSVFFQPSEATATFRGRESTSGFGKEVHDTPEIEWIFLSKSAVFRSNEHNEASPSSSATARAGISIVILYLQ